MARRVRKKHRQLELLNKGGTGKARVGQGERRRRTRAGRGKAPGPGPVGRPKKQGRRRTPHAQRPVIRRYQPQHVVLRVVPEMGKLRRRDCYRALRAATVAVARRGDRVERGGRVERGDRVERGGRVGRGERHETVLGGMQRAGMQRSALDTSGDIRRVAAFGAFRIVHVSIQQNHVHLLVEADDRVALARGMQAFQISAAKHLNAALGWEVRRRGRVFADRYHANAITNRRQARNALAYVLNNWRKHREDQGTAWRVDPFSTGFAFAGWRKGDLGADGRVECGWDRPPGERLLVAWEPRSWLLRVGWERYGAISVDEVPSQAPWL